MLAVEESRYHVAKRRSKERCNLQVTSRAVFIPRRRERKTVLPRVRKVRAIAAFITRRKTVLPRVRKVSALATGSLLFMTVMIRRTSSSTLVI